MSVTHEHLQVLARAHAHYHHSGHVGVIDWVITGALLILVLALKLSDRKK